MGNFEIQFYERPDGTRPVEIFLDSLSSKMRVKALDSLQILSEYGNQLREPYSKSLKNGLFELRIQFSNDISRIFYFFVTGRKIVITSGFIKKSPKTPANEIILALKFKDEYERRKSNE
ncbi:MAG: type II toxin-antitoxin system RelE/ParE family toxin [Eubacteriales bacterium]|nr:type II toxin-antitoxin system RelE/ParE family toxin [Eubacteriales bacterium]